jgi:hypothetical protein
VVRIWTSPPFTSSYIRNSLLPAIVHIVLIWYKLFFRYEHVKIEQFQKLSLHSKHLFVGDTTESSVESVEASIIFGQFNWYDQRRKSYSILSKVNSESQTFNLRINIEWKRFGCPCWRLHDSVNQNHRYYKSTFMTLRILLYPFQIVFQLHPQQICIIK